MKPLVKVILVISFLLFTATCSLSTAEAAIPHLINYQGRLTDSSGVPLNGSYQLTFRIYDSETAGNLLWQETHTGVVISKGIFNVLLGSVISLDELPFNKQYYLEIKVENEVMSPRQIIGSAAYAIAGVPSGVIVMWSGKIADIPSGWALCDGTNGTPDLRDRFVVGARQDENSVSKTNITGTLTQSGGSVSITVANLPSHSHTLSAHIHSINHIHGEAGGGGAGGGKNPSHENKPDMGSDRSGEMHNYSGNSGFGGNGDTGFAGSNEPYIQPYYALAYIMKL